MGRDRALQRKSSETMGKGISGHCLFLKYAAPKPCMLVTVAMLGKEKLPLLCQGTHGSIWSS